MIIIKGILAILWIILIPTILGFIITRKMEKYKNSIILSWIIGYFIEFGIFEFLSVITDKSKCSKRILLLPDLEAKSTVLLRISLKV